LLKLTLNYLLKNGTKGLRYVFIRLKAAIPMYIISKKFKVVGKNLYIEKPFKILNPKYIEAGSRFRVFSGSRIECIDRYENQVFNPILKIGNNVTINNYFHIAVINEIILEDYVLIAGKVYISDHNHGNYKDIHSSPNIPPANRELISPGRVILREKCWIGEGVCILPNVIIGKGSIIGANSVVTKNIPDFCIAAGNPAKVIKKYDFSTSQWCNVGIE